MAIRLEWLNNNGVRVTRKGSRGMPVVRFERPNGTLTVKETAAEFKTNEMKIYRLIEKGLLKATKANGEVRIPLSEVRRLWADRAPLADRRKAS